MLRRTQSSTVRRAKAAPLFIALLLEDPLLLLSIFDYEKLHADGAIGAAIEAIYHAHGKDVALIKLTLSLAVEKTQGPEQLFREDSIFTEITKRYMKYYGPKYLRKILKPTVELIVHHTKCGEEYGIDSSVTDMAAIDRTLSAAKSILQSVMAKANLMPLEIRVALTALVDAAEAKFGTSKSGFAVVGLFWLRFVCPAIVDPVQAGVLKRSPSVATASRAFLAVSKAVKAIAGGQLPENLHPVAATQLTEACSKWPSILHVCFQELRQPLASPLSPRRPEPKAAFMPAMFVLHVIQQHRDEFEIALMDHAGERTLRSLTPILDSLLSPFKFTALKAPVIPGPPTPTSTPTCASNLEEKPQRTTLVETWGSEKVLSWLDCIDLGHHKASFTRKQIDGAALLALDSAKLLELGVKQEQERWVLLQSVQDLRCLHERFATHQERRQSKMDTPVMVPMLRALPYDSLEESSGSSSPSSGRSLGASGSSNSPLSGSSLSSSPSGLRWRGNADGPAECVFLVTSSRNSVRSVKGKLSDSLATLQTKIEKELKVSGTLTYTEASSQRLLKLSTDEEFEQFLSTSGNVDSTNLSLTVYNVVILPSV